MCVKCGCVCLGGEEREESYVCVVYVYGGVGGIVSDQLICLFNIS